ncbi:MULTISPECIES: glutathione S-transferase family protein [unclassified Methylophilus]|uniref:glutathione S-transferase family protein n=1 Tax=unclassified Methylophilus TaxID=2630143 RepID=UPI0006F93170|nr:MULTISPECIES: glutathione S-transferase N-terminal domain-containing protein [unclassified Methylophilus]KQT41367.1 glutathione S-transferase [Methylophilus sp. Leaf416]KQT57888.1 glutathione S-transferase [Methylophilus sp. Leaf459]
MINLYTWATPNGRKISIMLEELGVDYEVSPVDLGKLQQYSPEFGAISPNHKIPAIVDTEPGKDPVVIFESGAILTYLAEKHGQFLAPSGQARYTTFEWLHWQTSALGPMLGQLGFFAVRSQEKAPLAITRFTEEADRLLNVMDKQLQSNTYLAGSEYSIADIASYAWTLAATGYLKEVLKDSLATKPALHRWLQTVGERPAVQRGMAIPRI